METQTRLSRYDKFISAKNIIATLRQEGSM